MEGNYSSSPLESLLSLARRIITAKLLPISLPVKTETQVPILLLGVRDGGRRERERERERGGERLFVKGRG